MLDPESLLVAERTSSPLFLASVPSLSFLDFCHAAAILLDFFLGSFCFYLNISSNRSDPVGDAYIVWQ